MTLCVSVCVCVCDWVNMIWPECGGWQVRHREREGDFGLFCCCRFGGVRFAFFVALEEVEVELQRSLEWTVFQRPLVFIHYLSFCLVWFYDKNYAPR